MSNEVWLMMRTEHLIRDTNTWPQAGGLDDQLAIDVDVVHFIGVERSRCEADEVQKLRA